MSFEPEKFFIGLMDFFSVLLPGAMLTYFIQDDAGPLLLGDRYAGLAENEGWMLFLFSSYLLGHFVFLVGSWLDDSVYERIRRGTDMQNIEQLACGKTLPPPWAQWMGRLFFGRAHDEAVRQAVRLKERSLGPIGAANAVNAFQWCKARLTFEQPASMTTVQRFEADSKFFRSLIVILCVLIVLGPLQGRPALGIVSLLALWPAFWRYVDQRKKATSQAYLYVLTLEGEKATVPSDAPVFPETHAGGVVYRKRGKQVEYLLVESSRTPNEWVLPKGHIEHGERMTETAVREVHEETAVWAQVDCELERFPYQVDEKPVKVQFYLMKALDEEPRPQKSRGLQWLPLESAKTAVAYDETKALLRLASTKVSRR